MKKTYYYDQRPICILTGSQSALGQKENSDVTLIALDTNQETILTNGAFENGSLSANGKFVALSRGDKEIEIWDLDQKRLLKRLKAIER